MDQGEEKLQEIDEAVSNIPDEILSAMEEIGFNEKIRLMAFDHKMTVDDSGKFHDLVEGYILGGYEDAEFGKRLENIVRDPNEIKKVGLDLNEKIFGPLRRQLVQGEFDSMERNGEFDEEEALPVSIPINQNTTPEKPVAPNAPFSIVGNNLSSSNITTPKESDYSMPKMGDRPRSGDPYLEPLDDTTKK